MKRIPVVSGIRIEDWTEIKRTSPVRAIGEGGSKNRTSIGSAAAIRQHFRAAAKTVTRLQPKARQRKDGEDTRSAFRCVALAIGRRSRLSQTYAAATVFLSEMLDRMNIWSHDTAAPHSEHYDSFDTKQDYLSPHL